MSPRTHPTLSAGVVVTRPTPEGRRYLLLRAYNYWDFPKGVVEAGEDPLVAARREVEEETGITQLVILQPTAYHQTAPYGRHKVARYYLGETQQEDVRLGLNPQLGQPEHHAFRWVSAAEAESLLVPRVVQALRWARQLLEDSGAG